MNFDRPAAPAATDRTFLRRLVWVTPDYPPNRGGVSDHSNVMVSVLRAAGHDVLVCTRPHERGFAHLDAEIAAYHPDLVIVAYTPNGYAPRTAGIAPAFIHWSMRLRKRLRYQAILLAHETSLSAAYHWKTREFDLVALAAVQVAQFAVLTACFDSVIFSNESTQRTWARLMPLLANRFHTTRICSNIPHHFSVDPAAELLAAGNSVPSPIILFFGTGHEAVLFAYLEAAFRALSELEPKARLVIVGMGPEKLREVRPTLADLGDRVQALGYVAAPQVSLWLQVATLVLAPLVEGVSARKGTVMAALQHGQAVVTTCGSNTLDDIAWKEICFLSPLDREAFTATAIEAFRSPERRSALGRAARTEYEANASAAVTAAQILDHARRARGAGLPRPDHDVASRSGP